LVTLLAFAISWLSVACGLVARSVESASNLPMPLILLPFLGSGFVPTDSMPAGLSWFAEHQPFTPIMDTLRALLLAARSTAGLPGSPSAGASCSASPAFCGPSTHTAAHAAPDLTGMASQPRTARVIQHRPRRAAWHHDTRHRPQSRVPQRRSEHGSQAGECVRHHAVLAKSPIGLGHDKASLAD
jgi:ABC-2 type transporter